MEFEVFKHLITTLAFEVGRFFSKASAVTPVFESQEVIVTSRPEGSRHNSQGPFSLKFLELFLTKFLVKFQELF